MSYWNNLCKTSKYFIRSSPLSLWAKFLSCKEAVCSFLPNLRLTRAGNRGEGGEGGPRKDRCRTFGSLLHLHTALIIIYIICHCTSLEKNSETNPIYNLREIWIVFGQHPMFCLALTASRLKRTSLFFFQSPVVGERGRKVWKISRCQILKSEMGEWRKGANISCCAFQREESGEVMWGGGEGKERKDARSNGRWSSPWNQLHSCTKEHIPEK